MREQLPPGPALDERVCRALGWTQILDLNQPGAFLGWPAVSTSGDVMLDAIEAMRGRGWDGFKLETLGDMSRNRGYWQKEGLWYCWFSGECGIRMKGGFHGETPAHAVALAILAALEMEVPK